MDERGDSSKFITSVLERVGARAPLQNLPMEYVSRPKRSPLQRCGLPAVEAAEEPAGEFVRALRAGGLKEDQAEVGAAILCLMMGGVDEAHNLVTPHSWSAPTPFGGPPKPRSTARTEATYCHMLIHRMEGTNIGEFGTGFNNSGFWMGNAFASGGHAIFPALRAAAEEVVGDCADAKRMLRVMGPNWDPRAFNRLCQDALEFEDPEALAFCEAVHGRELRLLFDHVTDGVAA